MLEYECLVGQLEQTDTPKQYGTVLLRILFGVAWLLRLSLSPPTWPVPWVLSLSLSLTSPTAAQVDAREYVALDARKHLAVYCRP